MNLIREHVIDEELRQEREEGAFGWTLWVRRAGFEAFKRAEIMTDVTRENDMDPIETMIQLIAYTCNGEFPEAREVLQDLEEWYATGYHPDVEAVAQALALRVGIDTKGRRIGRRSKGE